MPKSAVYLMQTTLLRTILSLCDYSGVWSEPYAVAGYDVVRIDLQDGQDVRLLKYPARSSNNDSE